jgi:DHA2 family multidrug resistance protein
MVFGMFMSILDIQVVSASLQQIQAGLSASSSEVSWVQTSYLIAEVIAIPLSGFLSRAFGTRLLFAISASGFTVASFFCGFASTIEQMILWRAIQGFLGAGMIPTVFASAYTVFPRSKFHIVGPIIGLVATLAPTIGPTVGGFITDMMSWHWLFFINIVPGIGITIGVWVLCDFDKPNFALLEHFDWWGLLFMAGFLGTLEYVLEEGPQSQWLEDTSVAVCAAICVVSAIAFFWRVLSAREPIVDLRTFTDRNFGCRLPDLVLCRHRPLRPHLHVSALPRRSARLQPADDRRDHVRLRRRHVLHRADRGPADGEIRHALSDRDRSGAVRARLLSDDRGSRRNMISTNCCCRRSCAAPA